MKSILIFVNLILIIISCVYVVIIDMFSICRITCTFEYVQRKMKIMTYFFDGLKQMMTNFQYSIYAFVSKNQQ